MDDPGKIPDASGSQGVVSPTDLIGQTFYRFKCVRKLGQGAMATVLLGEDTALKRPVAIKLLPQENLENPSHHIWLEQFVREARAAARLTHQGIVPVYEIGMHGGYLFIAMEAMLGGTLQALVKRDGALSIPRAVDYAVQVADALAYAHQQGTLHRDIKPGNILLNTQGQCKLGDFGLAIIDDPKDTFELPRNFLGTPYYLAPEVLRHKSSPQSDVYALGATLWFLLTGQHPFAIKEIRDVLRVGKDLILPDLRQLCPQASDELKSLLEKSLSRQPEDRFASGTELFHALAEVHHAASLEKSAPPAAATPAAKPSASASALSALVDATQQAESSVGKTHPAETNHPPEKTHPAEKTHVSDKTHAGEKTSARRPTTPAPRPTRPQTPKIPATHDTCRIAIPSLARPQLPGTETTPTLIDTSPRKLWPFLVAGGALVAIVVAGLLIWSPWQSKPAPSTQAAPVVAHKEPVTVKTEETPVVAEANVPKVPSVTTRASTFRGGTKPVLLADANKPGHLVDTAAKPPVTPDKNSTPAPDAGSNAIVQAADGSITLDANHAELHKNEKKPQFHVEPKGDIQCIGFWMDGSEWASWNVHVTQPGTFEITGELALKAGSAQFTIQAGEQKVTGNFPANGTWEAFKTVSLGKIEIKQAGQVSVQVRPVAKNWKGLNLANLQFKKVP